MVITEPESHWMSAKLIVSVISNVFLFLRLLVTFACFCGFYISGSHFCVTTLETLLFITIFMLKKAYLIRTFEE